MRINLITLKKQIAHLPAPQEAGQYRHIELMGRCEELSGAAFAANTPENSKVKCRAIMLVAVEYCRPGLGCWLEWELDL